MNTLAPENIIFYLNLSDKLPRNFVVMSQLFKTKGITLVPIGRSDLLQFTREVERVHMICMVNGIKEKSRFNKKIKKFLKLLIQSNMVDLYMVSSFSSIDETSNFRGKKNYHFVPLPIEADLLCDTICKTIEIKKKSIGLQ